MIEETRKLKIAVVFHYSPTNTFHMINVTRDESLERLRAFWEILGNLSAEDHNFLLSESVALPRTGSINDILPAKAFVIGVLVEPLQPLKYGSNITLATNFSDTLGLQDIWETIETDRKPAYNRNPYRLTLSNSEDIQKINPEGPSPASRASTIPPSVADNLSQDYSLVEGEVKGRRSDPKPADPILKQRISEPKGPSEAVETVEEALKHYLHEEEPDAQKRFVIKDISGPGKSTAVVDESKANYLQENSPDSRSIRQISSQKNDVWTNTDLSISTELPRDPPVGTTPAQAVITHEVKVLHQEQTERRVNADATLVRQSDLNSEQLDEVLSTSSRSKGTNTERYRKGLPLRPIAAPRESLRGVHERHSAPPVVDKVGCLQRMKWPIGLTRSPSKLASTEPSQLDTSSLCPMVFDESSQTGNVAKFVVICKWSQETFALRIPLSQPRLPVLALREAVESRIRELCRLEQLRAVRRSDLAPVVDVDFGFFFAGEDGARSQRSDVKDVVLHCLRDQDQPLMIPGHWSSMIFVYRL